MSGKSGMKCFGNKIINEVLKMKEDGKTNREISEFYGFKDHTVIKHLIKRHNRKQRKLQEGIEIKKRGRPRKNDITTEEGKDEEIIRLKMKNELLKSFIYETERWNARD